MRILMLGWEFPPYISGGLGTACHGLTDALSRHDARVLFVLPRSIDPLDCGDAKLPSEEDSPEPSEELQVAPIPCELTDPYHTPATRSLREGQRSTTAANAPAQSLKMARESSLRVIGVGSEDGYDGDLVGKIRVFTNRCVRLARRELFDVIHAHDWMTFPAAEAIAGLSGRPFVVHVHATEFDRSGSQVSGSIYEIERRGMRAADLVIAVSERTRRMIVERYGVAPEKVAVVHNGIELGAANAPRPLHVDREKNVLFLGRLTMQKGPEYFVRAAADVATQLEGVKFVMAGAGELASRMMDLVREFGMENRFEFTGFLRGADVERAYRRADVYVMPSVSEPFGLTALEAVHNGVPVVLSKSSGAAEVLREGALKVDYWDTEMMARMIVSILRYPGLAGTLRESGAREIHGLTWDRAAEKCLQVYEDLIHRHVDCSRVVAPPPGRPQPAVAALATA